MSHIITSHQLIGTTALPGVGSEHSLKRSYLAKKIAKLNRLLEAHLAILDRKVNEITSLTDGIDRLHALTTVSSAQKKQLKQLVDERAKAEKWILSSKLIKRINEIRHDVKVLNDSTLDMLDDCAV